MDAAQAGGEKLEWTRPELVELDVLETANGSIGSDGVGGGSQQGGNSSGGMGS